MLVAPAQADDGAREHYQLWLELAQARIQAAARLKDEHAALRELDIAGEYLGKARETLLAPKRPQPGAGAIGVKRGAGGQVQADCPCDSGRTCTGPRGGQYCVTAGGRKQYQ